MDNFFELSNLEQFYGQNPDSIVFSILASKYLEADMPDKARTVAEKGVERHPHYGFGHYVLALSYYRLQQLERAKRHLEMSIAYDEKNPMAWKLIGELYERFEQPALAANSTLEYYLLDIFNKDAVDRFYQEDTLNFDEFEDDPASPNNGSHRVDGVKVAGAIEQASSMDSDKSIEELFNEDSSDTAEFDISQKVEEVFKETFGDISSGTDLSVSDPAEDSEDDDMTRDFSFDNIDVSILNRHGDDEDPDKTVIVDNDPEDDTVFEPIPEAPLPRESSILESELAAAFSFETDLNEAIEDAKGAQGDAEEEDDLEADDDVFAVEDFSTLRGAFDDDATLEADDVTSNPNLLDNDDTTPAPDDAMDISNLSFDEPDIDVESPDNTFSDDVLDFSTFVDEFISERNEELNTASDPADEDSAEAENSPVITDPGITILFEEGKNTGDVEAEPPGGKADGETAPAAPRFGRPPIVSPTLGEIYIAQGRFEEAIDVFNQLLDNEPGNQRFSKKIQDIRDMMARQKI